MNDTAANAFSLYDDASWTPATTTDELDRQLRELFEAVGPDLGAEDPGDDAFESYASMMMRDAGVPAEIAEDALRRMAPGAHRLPADVLAALMAKVGFDAVETRNVDDLDFRDCAVWTVRAAIEAAFAAGFEAGKRGR